MNTDLDVPEVPPLAQPIYPSTVITIESPEVFVNLSVPLKVKPIDP